MDIRDRCIAVFEAARKDLAETLHREGISLTTSERVVAVTRDGGQWSIGNKIEEYAATRSPVVQGRIRELGGLDRRVTAQVLDLADAIAALHTETLPFKSPAVRSGGWLVPDIARQSDDDFESSPAHWLAASLVLPALEAYLTSWRALDEGDPGQLRRLVDELLSVARSPHVTLLTTVPLSGVDCPEAVSCRGATLRLLTDRERAAIYSMRFGGDRSPDNLFGTYVDVMEMPSHVLEIASSTGRGGLEIQDDRHLVILFAMQLFGCEPSVMSVHVRQTPDWINAGMLSAQLPIWPGVRGDRLVIDQRVWEQVIAISDGIQPGSFSHPTSPEAIARYRFAQGCSRRDAGDALLDFAISLEALLLRGASRSDLRYRFMLNGALFLTKEVSERLTVWDALKQIYDNRSQLVHGGKSPMTKMSNSDLATVRRLVAFGLRRAEMNGYPDADAFRYAALGMRDLPSADRLPAAIVVSE